MNLLMLLRFSIKNPIFSLVVAVAVAVAVA